VLGVVLEGGAELRAELIVDCLGRTTRVPTWLADEGLPPPSERSSDCGLVYYSRHFRWRDGVEIPPYASLLGGPRGDLGYLAFAVFIGDNRTFCLCIMTAPGDREFRAVRRSDAFLRVAERLPGVAEWVDPACAQPITPVLPMGRVHNVVRRYVRDEQPVAPGMWPVGDALSHTNPTFAFGASLALWHSLSLADAVDAAADETALARFLDSVVGDDAARRYDAVSAEDRDRARLWAGEPLDVTDPTASLPLYLRSVVYRAAPADPALLRGVARRIDLLDGPDALAEDEGLLRRADEIFQAMNAAGEIVSGPGRGELLSVIPG
jgi:2-polyprenyl-6-methoxyphenol hydroxylase-like FAD-dependent oxidoreductase